MLLMKLAGALGEKGDAAPFTTPVIKGEGVKPLAPVKMASLTPNSARGATNHKGLERQGK